MANTPALVLYGTHANRPAAGVVGDGSVYSESDTGKRFQVEAGSWVEISVLAKADLPAQIVEVANSTTLAPSATISTYGTAVTLLPGTGFTSLTPQAGVFTATSIGSETLTYRVLFTFSDTTTASVTHTATDTTAIPFTPNDLVTPLVSGAGLSIASIALACKSSISSSTAIVTAVFVAFDN